MGEFISGVLTRNAPGAQYEGAVYDRWLTLQHDSGLSLKLFDLFPPISAELSVGTRYEVVVSALVPIEVAVFSSAPPELPQGWWQGTIRELEWRVPPSAGYQHARAGLSDGSWLLVETQIGSLLMGPEPVQQVARTGGRTVLRVGDVIQWNLSRLDLQAVV